MKQRASKNSCSFKAAIDIDRLMQLLKKAYKSWEAPVITLMSHDGATPYKILISTILSLRTKDEVTAVAARRLFESAETPATMVRLSQKDIEKLIYTVGFYPTKAQNILAISRLLIEKYDSVVPDEIDELLKFPGVGRKTANLVLIEGYKKDAICVDTHVHRISNRIGYVKTSSADKTEMALRDQLPHKYWINYNEILVAFGQVICRPVSPFCSKCPIAEMCPKTGVEKSR